MVGRHRRVGARLGGQGDAVLLGGGGDLSEAPDALLEAQGAEVRRVDIERLSPEKLRTDEAKAILAHNDKLKVQVLRIPLDNGGGYSADKFIVSRRKPGIRNTPQ